MLNRDNLKFLFRYPTVAARNCVSQLRQMELRVGQLESRLADCDARLADYDVMRNIHLRDMSELEDLIRIVALPDLPHRDGRDRDLAGLMGTSVCEAFYIIDALHKALTATEGAVCEFGVAQGATSRLLAQEIRETNRHLFLFDSFEGLSRPSVKDRLLHDMFQLGSMDAYAGTMRRPESEVIAKLSEINYPMERVSIMKGWAQQTLADPRAPSKVAFAYIDFDLYEPIRATLAYVDAHSNIGTRVVVDDYGFFSEGAQIATDEFIAGATSRWALHRPLEMAGHFVTLERVSDKVGDHLSELKRNPSP